MAPKYGLVETGPARLIARSPGGGGWGEPAQRDRDRVARDVRDGVVSVEAAKRLYGFEPEEPGAIEGPGAPGQEADQPPS